MKDITQLLELAKNPYYKFTKYEQAVLDDFLSKRSEKASKKSQQKSSEKSSKQTPVVVKNIVKKADTYPPVAPENIS